MDEAVRNLKKAQKALDENEQELKTIDDRVANLKKEFASKTREAEKLRVGLEKTEEVLSKAQSLLGLLSLEHMNE